MRSFLGVISLIVATGCADQYAYVPTTNATASLQGKPAAEYRIPSSGPRGDVRIASYGLTDVKPRTAPNEIVRALHLRIVLANDADTPWTFDTREQRVQLVGGDAIAPAFASANTGSPPPLVRVDRGGKRVVDLFFLLPANLRNADAIPEFDALWRVGTGAGLVAERTPFERLAVEPDYGGYDDWDYGDDYYWGGVYWMNPDFSSFGYQDGDFRGGVMIRRSPHISHSGGDRGRSGGGFHGGDGGHGGAGQEGGHR